MLLKLYAVSFFPNAYLSSVCYYEMGFEKAMKTSEKDSDTSRANKTVVETVADARFLIIVQSFCLFGYSVEW